MASEERVQRVADAELAELREAFEDNAESEARPEAEDGDPENCTRCHLRRSSCVRLSRRCCGTCNHRPSVESGDDE